MHHNRTSRTATFLTLMGIITGLVAWQSAGAAAPRQETPSLQPQVVYPSQYDLSPALSKLASPQHAEGIAPAESHPVRLLPKGENALMPESLAPDPILQDIPTGANMPGTLFNFEGVPNINNVLPPDTNGDVGPNHYVQWVNLSLAVWQLNRNLHTATLVFGPVSGNTIWTGFGGACQNDNHGDTIALYDHLADRWFISQFALPNFPAGPFYQCIAVSQTANPTGGWYRYAYEWKDANGQSVMNDYPHFGVWPDAYYLTVNQFQSGNMNGRGAGVAAFERDKMLLGLPARMVYFDLYGVNQSFGGMLPSDLDGPPPPAGTPNYFAEADDSTWIPPNDALRIWQFHVDWSNPANSTFGLGGNPNQALSIANFIPFFSLGAPRRVPQPNTTALLDSLSDRLMYRLQYRYFGSYATLVANHTVDAGDGRAAVRWYELRNTGGDWVIHQQGTYAGVGANSLNRWMASAAMDRAGDIAIGYSTSSSTQYPSIAYTGRLAADPLNSLPQGEATLQAGSGSQTHSAGRWGDYSMLGIDPTDDCTFWYTNEYYSPTSPASWRTRIGSFAFPSCFSPLTGTLEGTVSSSGNPVADATVKAGEYSTQTNPDGSYNFPAIPLGTYTMTVTANGYLPASISGVHVDVNAVTTQDFSLVANLPAHVHGIVTDGSGQGWPLYARIEISAPGQSQVLYTNPLTGLYSVDLPQGINYTFTVSAVSSGYQQNISQLIPVAPDTVQNFTLNVDASCSAPGYILAGSCTARSGGLLIGHVQDENTGIALNGATVTSVSAPADTTQTFPTPDDPTQDDGLYILFSSLTGTRLFTASKASYGSDAENASILNGGITHGDFLLPAGRLSANPTSLSERVNIDNLNQVSEVVTLSNSGDWPVNFSVSEVNTPLVAPHPTGPFAEPTRHTSPKHLADLDASAVYSYTPPQASQLPGGTLLQSWSSGLVHPWGIGVETGTGELWIGDVSIRGGDDRLHRFLPNGTRLGEAIDTAASGAYYSASMVYDPFSAKFWQVSVGGNNCLVEIDPNAHSFTGKKICPAFDNSQRGLAFNPLNRTYYSGAWTNGILYHFDEAGMILDSANLDLNISGLAFNPATRHLFVLSNANQGFDVYVLDTEHGYAILGGFDIPGLGSFEQAGMSMDCSAHLWMVDQANGQVFEVDSGEAAACAYADVTWLSVAPTTGSVSQGANRALIVTFDPALAPAGFNQASLVITNDTPYGSITIPVSLYLAHPLYMPMLSK